MDQELIAYLDERFRESAQQITALRQETLERFEKIDTRFEKIDARFEKIDARFEKMEDRFEKMEDRFEKMEDRFEKVESSVHQTQIMLEDLRDKTQLLAEGLSGVDEKLQSFREEVNERFDQAQKTTILYYSDLDRRLRVVEQRTERENPRL